MEFGGFDDDLFGEEKIRNDARTLDYKPKRLTPQWFVSDESLPQDDSDRVHFLVFRADHSYYCGEWATAAESYATALGLVAPSNPCMRRLLLEDLARCKLKCGEVDAAVEMGQRLLEESTSENQMFGAHSVLASLLQAAGDDQGEINSLKFCLGIRPLSVQHWIQLGKAYLRKGSCAEGSQAHWHCGKGERTAEGAIANSNLAQNNTCEQRTEDSCTISAQSRDLNPPVTDQSMPDSSTFNLLLGNGYQGDSAVTECIYYLASQLNISPPNESSCDVASSGMKNGGDVLLKGSSILKGRGDETGESVGKGKSSSFERRAAAAIQKNMDGTDVVTTAVNTDTTLASAERTERLGRTECEVRCNDKRTEDEADQYPIAEAIKCLVRAQVILKSLQICAVSITRQRNAELLQETANLLAPFQLSSKFMQDLSEAMYQIVFYKDDK